MFEFEGLQEKMEGIKLSVLEWLEHDRERGARHERILAGIHRNTSDATEVEYDYVTQTVALSYDGGASVGTTRIDFPVVPQGQVWEYMRVAMAFNSVTGIVEARLDESPIGIMGAVGFSTSTVLAMDQPLIVTEGRRLSVVDLTGTNNTPANVQVFAQLIRHMPREKKLPRDYGDSEAEFYSKPRTGKAQVNFGQDKEVPDERHTIEPATATGREEMSRVGEDPRAE